VKAATVNPTDTYTRNGARAAMLKDFAPPYVSGMDAAGIVDEIGEGTATNLTVGDSVMAIVIPNGGHGAYSEYIVVPAESAVHIPTGVSFAAASTLPMNGLTARLSLDQLALKPGQTLAVTGAAGAYGGYVVQLAKADGLRVMPMRHRLIKNSFDRLVPMLWWLVAMTLRPYSRSDARRCRCHCRWFCTKRVVVPGHS
jgi:NADPH:quinone reductase